MSYPLAGPDRSQQATTERRIGRKPRKYRDKFESMPCPEKRFYNNDLWLAVDAVLSEPVSGRSRVNREFFTVQALKQGGERRLARGRLNYHDISAAYGLSRHFHVF